MTHQTQVIKIIAEQMATQEVSPEMSFEDLGCDSLDEVEIVMALEEEFEVRIGDPLAEKIKTVQEAVDVIDALKAKINCLPVQSSQMEAIGHEGRTLAVQFKNGLYHYPGVTAEEFEAFKNAESLGSYFGKDIKTVRRWEKGETPCPAMLEPALRDLLQQPTAAATTEGGNSFRFIDLFAGIGGIRMGFEAHGGECVFTSEWNDFSKKTYLENYGDNHPFVGDIVPYPAEDVPDHDVLLGGFPCQPFSIAGVSKKNSLGRPHGFECTTQGTLFFDVARIIATKRPKAFLLENVKNLLSHDKGHTFDVILQTLRDELGYDVHYKIIDGQHFTPQHRERIIIVGFRENTGFSWDDLMLPKEGPRLASILHKTDGTEPLIPWDGERFFDHGKRVVQPRYTLTPNLWAYLQAYAEKHRAAGNGFGFGMAYPDSVTRTLSARYHKDGSEILVWQGKNKRPRRLTPRECARLMGFPDTFRIPVSDTQAYRQFGNSVVMPVMQEVARIMAPHIRALVAHEQDGTPLPLRLFA